MTTKKVRVVVREVNYYEVEMEVDATFDTTDPGEWEELYMEANTPDLLNDETATLDGFITIENVEEVSP